MLSINLEMEKTWQEYSHFGRIICTISSQMNINRL